MLIIYEVKKYDLPLIKFSNKKKEKEQDHSAYDKYLVLKVYSILSKQRNKSDALHLHLMFTLVLKPAEVRLIKFEVVELKNDQYFIKVNKTKKVKLFNYLYHSIFMMK